MAEQSAMLRTFLFAMSLIATATGMAIELRGADAPKCGDNGCAGSVVSMLPPVPRVEGPPLGPAVPPQPTSVRPIGPNLPTVPGVVEDPPLGPAVPPQPPASEDHENGPLKKKTKPRKIIRRINPVTPRSLPPKKGPAPPLPPKQRPTRPPSPPPKPAYPPHLPPKQGPARPLTRSRFPAF
ncbi:hypothetical protein AJ78_08042, partial [Emergomyces pasteurianus Ep9510]